MGEQVMNNRRRGALIGLAVGAAVEFKAPGSFAHVTGYRNGGPHRLEAGEWTDDTSMAVAIAESLAARADLRLEKSLDAVLGRWQWWARNAKDNAASVAAAAANGPGGNGTAYERKARGRILMATVKGDVHDMTPLKKVQARIQAVSHKFPGEILIAVNDRSPELHDIYRLDLDTGKRELVHVGALHWRMAVASAARLEP